MSKNITIRIGGVPEHFNLPWLLAIEDNAFVKEGIDLQWQDIPEGTGRMSQMLRNGELDVACILTDGIIKDIIAGNPSRVLQVYVSSPLLWGVHTWAENTVSETQNMTSRKFAISRFGSGSHLMSYLLASKYAWKLDQLDFRLVDTLEGAIKSLSSREADLFLWERYMTQPIVDKGIFKRLETIAPPWPSFVIAARFDFIENNKDTLAKVLAIINRYTADFKEIPSIDRTIASYYNLEEGDVQQWLLRTQYSDDQLWNTTISRIIEDFTAVGIIERKVGAEDLIYNLPKIDEEE